MLMTAIFAALVGLAFGVFYLYESNVYSERASTVIPKAGSAEEDAGDLYSDFLYGAGVNHTAEHITMTCGFPKIDMQFYIQENASSIWPTRWKTGRYDAESSNLFVPPGSRQGKFKS
ncbi:hypothetical protein RQP46_004594 [Phenoliferia psychrophenolica]